ncbi:putative 6-methylsalicylic acid synthase [Rhypophila decipiens]|uniref:6-methylsalicylic acid synthase n=1 Tax=Rhypophila decipiens TaxID=261697 RepID=A0AAN7B6S7_9PEZI|nr:putative 6-methylsalicylic acid synthase [Rhypophila decipiens]
MTPSEAAANFEDPTQLPPSSGSSAVPGPIFTPAPPSDTGTADTSNADSVSSYSVSDSSADDIAIVGMALRVPGENNTSPSSLWNYLLAKECAASSIPPSRWEPYHSRHPLNKSILSKTTSKGYFLPNLPDFDASFFSISPREAEQMDPQQRLALELAWEALEDAGIAADKQQISGPENTTSVYMGVNSDDYGKLVLEDLANIGAHMGVGTAYCGVPSRISHSLNLMGPSIAVDAACASSLVAVHMARRAILAGETEVAIVGGVNALIGPGLTRVLDEAGAIAADGVCRSFDDAAKGYGRGEGGGVVVLKKLDKALEDGDRIHAVLKGSAVCGDGKTLGIMAPNAAAQRLVAKKALKEAKLAAESIGYVEAHATSTPLGDPTEMEALADVYGRASRPEGAPCYVGSIKPNIGHLEAAAGVLGLIKSVMVLKHGVVPAQANLDKHSTKIDWDSHSLVVPKEPTKLSEWARPMRAAVASYGYSGTVSHAIIEASPLPEKAESTEKAVDQQPVLLFLSAPQATRLPAAAKALAQWLETAPDSISLEEVATTLASRRNHHKYRTSVTAATREEAIAALNKLANGEEDPCVVGTNASQHRASAETVKKGVMWIFSGHGAQWPGMGKELMATQPIFRETIHRLEPIVQRELGFSVLQALQSEREDHSTDENQIMTYAMHIGLANILIAEAGPPAAVVGHSLGETAAAVVSGALSFEEGTVLACTRARLYRRQMGTGGMALVSIGAAEMRAKLAEREDKGIDVAIDASPTSCVIAGPKQPVMELVGELMASGVKLFPLPTDIAFHSRSLLELVEPLRETLEPVLQPKVPTTTRLYSSWTADARSAHPRNAEYWVNNMVKPVLLHSAIQAIAEDGYRAFVEVASHPIAAYSMSEILEVAGVSDAAVLPTMIRGKPAMKQLLTTVGRLHCLGYPVNYTSKNDNKPWCPDVPRTIWSHVPYWREVSQVPKRLQAAHDPSSNNLLGSRTAISGTKAGHVLFQTTIDDTTKPFPGNHPLHGSEIVPAAVLVNTFLHAIDTSAYCLEGVSLKVPVVVSPAREIQILLEEGKSLTITSRLSESDGNGAWLVNTTSGVAPSSPSIRTLDITEIKARLQATLPSTFSTGYLAKVGVPEMGFPWAIQEHLVDNAEDSTEMLALVATNPDNTIKSGLEDLGASIMDAATSIASTIFHKDPLLRMPTSIGKVRLYGKGKGEYPVDLQKGYIHCVRTKMTKTEFVVDVAVLSESGDVVVEFESMAFAGIEPPSRSGQDSRKSENATELVQRIAWLPATPSEKPLAFSKVILFSPGEEGETGVEHSVTMGELTRLFQSRGYSTAQTAHTKDLVNLVRADENAIVIHVPRTPRSTSTEDISNAAAKACEGLVSAVQALSTLENTSTRLFSLIIRSGKTGDLSNAAFSSLYGLSRIMKSEMPDIFAGLFDLESKDNLDTLPTSLKYIQNADIVRYQDYIPRIARLRPLLCPAAPKQPMKKTEFSPAGTYLITGGLGALGLQVARWMADRGARRLVLLSRRSLPGRSTWPSILSDGEKSAFHEAIATIVHLESLGCSVYALPLDITLPTFPAQFSESLTSGVLSSLPAISGVIHAAGVLIDQPIPEITTPEFNAVLSPKVTGALHLHNLFPPGTLDFFILFSSCGQLLGFPGQGSYASGNAFLDGLAQLRREQGDKGVKSILWTSWKDLGMAGGATGNAREHLSEADAKVKADYISAELTARGVGDVTPEEAFAAWDVITSHEGHVHSEVGDGGESNVVVLRALEVDADEEAAVPILEEVAPRRERAAAAHSTSATEPVAAGGSSGAGRPTSGPELEKYLMQVLKSAVATTLGLSEESVDTSLALAEMGMDSVMTVAFRTMVQKKVKVKMAPTLVWKCPTVGHLVAHFMGELSV